MSDASPAAYGLTKHLILPLSLPFGGERDTIDAREASRRKDCFIPARIPKPYPTLRQSRDTSVAAEGTFVHIFTRARGSWMKKPCFLPPSISEADHPAPDCDAMPQTTSGVSDKPSRAGERYGGRLSQRSSHAREKRHEQGTLSAGPGSEA
jgi:hypothetical protein